MPRSDSLRKEIADLQKIESGLRKDASQQEGIAARARAEAAKKRTDAARTKSASSASTYRRSAESEEKKVVAAEKKVAEIKDKIARNASTQAAKAKSLTDAEKTERQDAERKDQRRRKQELDHARELARISRPTVRYVMVQEPKPEPLRVLYLTANPEATERVFENPDGSILRENTWLRTEAEVRSVQNALRGSKYRDLVDLKHRPAATFQDLLDGINDVRPHIVHFSGHGGEQTLLLDNGSADAPEGKVLPFDLLVETLAATDTPPTMLVLNACDTLEGADLILPAVPVVIAMSAEIGDAAASVFATQFYAAIASAQSVGSSLRQAKLAMRAASLDDAILPEHIAREGVEIDGLILVKTEADNSD